MQVSLTAMGGLERRLEVAVPAADVTSEIESRLKQLARTSRLKGFRPGKAPLPVVRKQFGDQVRAEVVSDIMRKSFAEAVSKEQLTPAAGPRIEPIALDPGSDLKYAAVFEVMPEVKVAPFAAIQIQRPSAAVTEADVDAMIESMRRQRPEFQEVSRVAQSTDRVTVDYDGTVGAEAFEAGQGRDVPFVIGAGQVLPQFDQAALGAAAGETREVTISYPENHGSKALAGKTAQFKLTVKKIEEQRLPPVDDEFCRAYGVEEGGIDMLRTEVRASMEREMNSVIRGRVRNRRHGPADADGCRPACRCARGQPAAAACPVPRCRPPARGLGDGHGRNRPQSVTDARPCAAADPRGRPRGLVPESRGDAPLVPVQSGGDAPD
jgi:trigger factor